jgi:hypothetical protein
LRDFQQLNPWALSLQLASQSLGVPLGADVFAAAMLGIATASCRPAISFSVTQQPGLAFFNKKLACIRIA